MNLSPFNWIRRKVAESVVAGVADGLRAVAPDDEPPASLDDLRQLLAAATEPKALPPAGDEPKTRKAK